MGTDTSLSLAFRRWLLRPLERPLRNIYRELEEVKVQMALNAAELKQRINDATNNIAGDVSGLKAKLEQALADQGVAVEGAVQEALSGLDVLATNLENLAASTPEDPIEEPETPSEPEVPGEAPDVEPEGEDESGEVAGPSDPFATDEDGDPNSANPDVQ